MSRIPKKAAEHRDAIIDEAAERIYEKYNTGQKEHGGFLPDLHAQQLIENAIDEAVDQVVYLLTLRDKL